MRCCICLAEARPTLREGPRRGNCSFKSASLRKSRSMKQITTGRSMQQAMPIDWRLAGGVGSDSVGWAPLAREGHWPALRGAGPPLMACAWRVTVARHWRPGPLMPRCPGHWGRWVPCKSRSRVSSNLNAAPGPPPTSVGPPAAQRRLRVGVTDSVRPPISTAQGAQSPGLIFNADSEGARGPLIVV